MTRWRWTAIDIGKQLVVLEYRLNLDDLLEAARARETLRSRLLRRGSIAAGSALVVALLSVPVITREVPDSLGAFLLGVLPLAVVMVVLPWYYNPVRIQRSRYSPYYFPSCRTEIAENGIRVTWESNENLLLWKAFDTHSENKTQFVLDCRWIQYILPKRAIEPSKVQEFESLLRSKIPTTSK
jgi:hypothetical protein